jgi:hypothetical protein
MVEWGDIDAIECISRPSNIKIGLEVETVIVHAAGDEVVNLVSVVVGG